MVTLPADAYSCPEPVPGGGRCAAGPQLPRGRTGESLAGPIVVKLTVLLFSSATFGPGRKVGNCLGLSPNPRLPRPAHEGRTSGCSQPRLLDGCYQERIGGCALYIFRPAAQQMRCHATHGRVPSMYGRVPSMHGQGKATRGGGCRLRVWERAARSCLPGR